ncbi:MAG: dTMP kinase [Actinobacteria bacterium]|nr:dTMP kinase [Actinomycetota bacterium]
MVVGPDGRRAPFIVFEGGEGGGKSTQAALLAERIDAVLTREPGGTAIGAQLRAILLDAANTNLSDRAEALLMAADRAQHAHELIRPNLESGTPVISDRYLYSSVAYQGHARGQDPEQIRDVSLWAVGHLLPDVVVLIDVDLDTANARLQRDLDRFEQAGDAFHRRVRDGFLAQAAAEPERWVVVDGAQAVDRVAEAVWAAVEPAVRRYVAR